MEGQEGHWSVEGQEGVPEGQERVLEGQETGEGTGGSVHVVLFVHNHIQ